MISREQARARPGVSPLASVFGSVVDLFAYKGQAAPRVSETPGDAVRYSRAGDFSAFTGWGLARREVFAHVAVPIPKPYPASQYLLEARDMSRRLLQRGEFYQLNLYTTDFFDLPEGLFWHPEINWHHQQFGMKGLVAVAGLWIKPPAVVVIGLQSDLCQQLFRHAEFRSSKTQVQKRFNKWHAILLNAVLDFCAVRGLKVLYSPTGRQIVGKINKKIDPRLFIRVYDFPPERFVCHRTTYHNSEYWEIPLEPNMSRIARLRNVLLPGRQDRERPQISIFHDIEENVDTNVSIAECADNLGRMLQIEKDLGCNGNYDVLGTLLEQKRREIHASKPQHSIAFHSFNHRLEETTQLPQCRQVDLRVRGYRPPQSRISAELTDYNLTLFDFEWLASSAWSLRFDEYKLENGLVKIPIHGDDYPLFTGACSYEAWEHDILQKARAKKFFAFGLHDCYAGKWLARYPELLHRLGEIGDFVTADEICGHLFLAPGDQPVRL